VQPHWVAMPGCREILIDLSNLAARARLKMPPLIDTGKSGRLNLMAMSGKTEFFRGSASHTSGYNQSYLGPVVRVYRGPVQAKVENQTAKDISVHWHGMKVSGDIDGGPHSPVKPGAIWQPELNID
jgi:blue copper oxidase